MAEEAAEEYAGTIGERNSGTEKLSEWSRMKRRDGRTSLS
jgi:hypothetical protein